MTLWTTIYCVNPLFSAIFFYSHPKCGEKVSKTPHLLWLFLRNVEYVKNSIKLFYSVENPVETVENLLFFFKNYSL